jgi:MFS family permease
MPGLGTEWRKLWAADAVSSLGDGAFLAAVPLLAVSLTGNPRLVAGVATAGTLPWLLFSLYSGALVDRYERRRLMYLAQWVQAGCVAAVGLATTLHSGRIWLLYLAAFGIGTAETVFSNAAQTILPQVVSTDRLEAANGRQYATETITQQFVGPPLGAWLFAAAAALPFWLDAASFAVSALLIARVRVAAPVGGGGRRGPVRKDIAEGLAWLYRHRLLRTLALLLAANNLAGQLAMSTMVLFATRVVGVGPRGYGLMLAGAAVGGVAGGLVARRVVDLIGTRATIIVAMVIGSVVFLSIGLFARDPVTVAALNAGWSLLIVLWNVATVSLRQRVIPDRLRGRVNSAYRLAGWGSMPIGALLGGVIAGAWGLPAPWLVAGGIRLVALLAGLAALRPSAFAAAEAEVAEPQGSLTTPRPASRS